MKLIQTRVREGIFGELLEAAINGDTIVLYEGEWDEWKSHPQGVVIRQGDEFLLNGETLLYKGKWDAWKSHPQGVAVVRDNRLLLNGETFLSEVDWADWNDCCVPGIFAYGKKILLHEKILLYEGERDDWNIHPWGVIIRRGNEFLLVVHKPS